MDVKPTVPCRLVIVYHSFGQMVNYIDAHRTSKLLALEKLCIAICLRQSAFKGIHTDRLCCVCSFNVAMFNHCTLNTFIYPHDLSL